VDELLFLCLFQIVFGDYTGNLHSPFYLSACGISLFLWCVGWLSLEKKFEKRTGKPASEIPWSLFYRLVSLFVVVISAYQ